MVPNFEWEAYLEEHSKFGTATTIKDTLRRRMRNCVERGFVARDGNTYAITDAGLAHAGGEDEQTADPKRSLLKMLKDYNQEQLAHFRQRLAQMDAYRFEHLVRELLEAMEYEDVDVTKQSGDRGVDVVAKHQYGITEITEVVQVKRTMSTIQRSVVDQLRGALPYHRAIRGTIITLGRFARGCADAALFPNAAPITLIDGNRLIELLVKHEIGIRKRAATLIAVDDTFFTEGVAEAEAE